MDAGELGAAFAAGTAAPTDAVEACLERIAEVDATLGICTAVESRAALLEAGAAAGARWRRGEPLSALDGVPFGVKANIAVAGLAWHGGIAAFRRRRARADAAVVARLRAAGMIPAVICNMHEAALGQTSQNPAYRATRNPHAPERIPGGSSGGSAAAVAAGIVPVALGTDDLGSVRLPSAFCGVVGLKPAYGELPTAGVMPLSPSLDHVGIHARSVADTAAVLGLFRESAPAAPQPRLGEWRVDIEYAPPVALAFETVREHLDGAAASAWADADLSALRRAGLLRCERDAGKHFAAALDTCAEGFSAAFCEMVAWAAAQPETKLRRAAALLGAASGRLRADLRTRLLVSPTTPHLPPTDAAVPPTLADLTAPAAIAGVAAISVPMGFADGLPMGVQIMGAETAQVLDAASGLFPGKAALAAGGVG